MVAQASLREVIVISDGEDEDIQDESDNGGDVEKQEQEEQEVTSVLQARPVMVKRRPARLAASYTDHHLTLSSPTAAAAAITQQLHQEARPAFAGGFTVANLKSPPPSAAPKKPPQVDHPQEPLAIREIFARAEQSRSHSRESHLQVDSNGEGNRPGASKAGYKSSDPTLAAPIPRPRRNIRQILAARMVDNTGGSPLRVPAQDRAQGRRVSIVEIERSSDDEDDREATQDPDTSSEEMTPVVDDMRLPPPPTSSSPLPGLARPPRFTQQKLSLPPANPSPIVKRPKGRPRKYPLPDAVAQPKIAAFVPQPVPVPPNKPLPSGRVPSRTGTPAPPEKTEWEIAEEKKRKAARRARDHERRIQERRLQALERDSLIQGDNGSDLPRLRDRKSAIAEEATPPPPTEENPVSEETFITVEQDERPLKKCKVVETPVEKLVIAEEVLVPTFRLFSGREVPRKGQQPPGEDEEEVGTFFCVLFLSVGA